MLDLIIHNITLGSQTAAGAVDMQSGTLHKVSKLDWSATSGVSVNLTVRHWLSIHEAQVSSQITWLILPDSILITAL